MISIFVETVERLAQFVNEADLKRVISEKFEHYVSNPLHMAADLWSTYLTLVVSLALLKRFAGKAIDVYSDYKRVSDNVSQLFLTYTWFNEAI